MYVTTFYSFKGGVGRSMALVNAAVTLAKRGRRVLVVDFDLEAPGLDTFDVLKPAKEVPGIIDFVGQYLETGQSPDARDFITECPPIAEGGGNLWIMPSGRNEGYSASFNQIDWGNLYERHDGFLLFEDLKQQWRDGVKPDYVLIDSRTGHTDTSGICTRQLPDAVVVLFFPNEQNLRGLVDVVEDIRKETEGPRKKNIELHYVMSNVPYLDDEDQILENKIQEFQSQLGFPQKPMIVHRYDSLSLLNQVVFSKDRPKSRLANEYETIVREISVHNWNDRDGALEYLQRKDHDSILMEQKMLDKIESAHRTDGEMQFRLGEFREYLDEYDSALSLIDRAISLGYKRPEAYLKRSRIRSINGDSDGVMRDAWRVLEFQDVPPRLVREALSRLTRHLIGMDAPHRNQIVQSPAVWSLDPEEKIRLAGMFNRSNCDVRLGVDLLEQILCDSDVELSEMQLESVRHELGLLYMGVGRCSDAADMFRDEGKDIDEMNIQNIFNYAMAQWGIYETLETELFKAVVDIDQSDSVKYSNPNYHQCMAIAYWAIGDCGSALDRVKQAKMAMKNMYRMTEFSCWSYLRVNMKEFSEDLDEIKTLVEGCGPTVPKYISLARKYSSDIH